jgi:hypothetical protein
MMNPFALRGLAVSWDNAGVPARVAFDLHCRYHFVFNAARRFCEGDRSTTSGNVTDDVIAIADIC